jgi:hypothetical protein
MAKIILVSKQVHSTAWQLALALKAQQHEVVLLTSYGESPRDSSNVEIMAYFKKWNALEGLRIIPGLFGVQPQILHFVLDEDVMSSAQIVLSLFAKSHPSCILTTSLLDIRKGLKRRNPVRYLIEESDIVTCPTVEGLGQLRGLDVRSTRQGRGILAPVLEFGSAEKPSIEQQDEIRLLEQLSKEKYFVLPFREKSFDPESESFHRIRTLAQRHKVVLWGTYAHWSLRDRKKFANWMAQFECGKRWVVTGALPLKNSRLLLEKSEALVLAGQHYSPVEMTEYYMRAIQAQAVMILDSKQINVHADLWRNSINCWVLNYHHSHRDLIRLLGKPNLRLPETLSEELALDRHLIDSSMNELNRLYNRALAHLR